MPARPPSHKVYNRRYEQNRRELRELANLPAPIIRDESNLCRECKRRGAQKNCPRCAAIAEQRRKVAEALAAEL